MLSALARIDVRRLACFAIAFAVVLSKAESVSPSAVSKGEVFLTLRLVCRSNKPSSSVRAFLSLPSLSVLYTTLPASQRVNVLFAVNFVSISSPFTTTILNAVAKPLRSCASATMRASKGSNIPSPDARRTPSIAINSVVSFISPSMRFFALRRSTAAFAGIVFTLSSPKVTLNLISFALFDLLVLAIIMSARSLHLCVAHTPPFVCQVIKIYA